MTEDQRFFRERPSEPAARPLGEKVSGKATEKVRTGAKCETCGASLEYGGIGRPRKFCGDACYAAAHNERRRVVPRYIYVLGQGNILNPAPGPKSKVR